jgi:release factor glutamine methyltransferase
MRIDQCLQEGAAKLVALSDSAQLDAQLLLSHVLQVKTSYLYTWPEKMLDREQRSAFNELLAARISGEPIAYLLGVQEFWSLEFDVSPCTLIPRADTEVLVEIALEKVASLAAPKVLDLGTGTGAVALAIASERSTALVHGVDLIEDAVLLARKNAKKLNLNALIYQSRWFTNVDQCGFDVIVSNPPYIDALDHHLDEGDVRFEPKSALVADLAGYADIQIIAQEARNYLIEAGWLAFEHGFEQAEKSQQILRSLGYSNVSTVKDYAGNDRVTLGQWSG